MTDGKTDGTENITSTADAGGNEIMMLFLTVTYQTIYALEVYDVSHKLRVHIWFW